MASLVTFSKPSVDSEVFPVDGEIFKFNETTLLQAQVDFFSKGSFRARTSDLSSESCLPLSGRVAIAKQIIRDFRYLHALGFYVPVHLIEKAYAVLEHLEKKDAVIQSIYSFPSVLAHLYKMGIASSYYHDVHDYLLSLPLPERIAILEKGLEELKSLGERDSPLLADLESKLMELWHISKGQEMTIFTSTIEFNIKI